ncbi:MAG: hypothetical protein ACO3JF_05770 [Ilumatobacteraceae bacterium]
MASGSSAKKVARLAQKGKGRKVRFQGGTMFPAVMTVVVVLGLGLVAYARQAEPDSGSAAAPSEISYAAYGFYKCDDFMGNLTADADVQPDNTKYQLTSSTPGVFEWRPAGLPRYRAKLGVFLESYGVKVDTKGITFPAGQNSGEEIQTSDLKCKDAKGKEVEAQVQVVVWDSYDNQNDNKKYITDFNNIKIDQDGMAVTIAIAAPGVDIPIPASASELKALADANDATTATSTTVATSATTTTVPG